MAALLAVLALPAVASAADTYVTTTALDQISPVQCPEQAPCTLADAVSLVGPNRILVAPGSYDAGSGLTLFPGASLEAAPGQAAPLIHGTSPTVLTAGAGSTLNRVVVKSDNGGTAVALGSAAVMNDSVAWSPTGTGASAPGVATFLNSTVIGSAHGILGGAVGAVTVTNVIARGGDGLGTSGESSFLATNSNFNAAPNLAVTGAGNQSAQPLFVNPGAGDFREAPGSPTIDGGIAAPSLTTDLAGTQRVLGLATDIGAFEYLPHLPVALSGAAQDITSTAAALTGSVDPNGFPTSYHFDYGATSAYGQSTSPQDAGSGVGSVPVISPLTGLTPGSVVHYRLAATSVDGTDLGIDRLLVVPGGAMLPGMPLPQGTGPQITSLNLPVNQVVGQPTTLTIRADDPKRAVNAIAVSFGERDAFFAESSCRNKPRSRIFDGLGSTKFTIPYTFTTPGVHEVQVALSSGGCGRSRKTTTQTVTVDTAPAPAGKRGAAVVAAAGCAGGDLVPSTTNLKAVKKATLCLLNQQRKANGLGGLRTNKKLTKAAKLHNGYMARGKFFAHQGPGEPSLGQRFRKVRYFAGGGENLAIGVGVPYSTPASMVDAWMASPLHRANILEKKFHVIGIDVMAKKPVPDPQVPGATYTTEFGTTRK